MQWGVRNTEFKVEQRLVEFETDWDTHQGFAEDKAAKELGCRQPVNGGAN
jgi:hypothetical protein